MSIERKIIFSRASQTISLFCSATSTGITSSIEDTDQKPAMNRQVSRVTSTKLKRGATIKFFESAKNLEVVLTTTAATRKLLFQRTIVIKKMQAKIQDSQMTQVSYLI